MQVVTFDLETCGVEELHHRSDFVRLGGLRYSEGNVMYRATPDGDEIVRELNRADVITGHNILSFDLIALARYHGADYEALAAKAVDTMVVEHHLNPVPAKKVPAGTYGLDQTAHRYGVSGKTDDIRKLARKHGGFDKIPVDDEEYNEYLRGDTAASSALYEEMLRQPMTADDVAYIRREHAVQTVMGRITLEGFRVDVEELERRYQAGEDRQAQRRARLVEQYGMPEGGKKPHTTTVGRAAFRAALEDSGLSAAWLDRHWPTGKQKDDGTPGPLLTDKDTLNAKLEELSSYGERAAGVVELIETIKAMNGERTVYATIRAHREGDRVHPQISPEQSSGRWSVTNPGLTVLGKRGGKHVERGVLLADEGEWLVAVDADQVDARGVAGMCQDPAYMALFEPGRDLHSEVAWRIWSSPLEHGPDCTDEAPARCKCERRDRAKVFGHGFSYGLGPGGMAKQHGVALDVAQEFVAGMTRAFPGLAEWKDATRREAGVLEYGETAPENDAYRILHTGYGRPVRVERSRAYTQATAQLGQGTTRDIMAEAALCLPFPLRRRIRAVIHDEFIFSVPGATKEEAAAYGREIADSMAFGFRGVPITFGSSPAGRNWADCYSK